VLAAKADLRVEVWAEMRAAKVARFPGAEHRIPNFVGAERAAELLRGTSAWTGAATVKANPDSPQLPVRQRALEDGKTVYMAVPRLADEHPFIALDPATLTVPPRKAASITGAAAHGSLVDVEELAPVDMAVVGCVAVSADGARLGKGGGFSDLEYALLAEAGMVSERTIVATTVHPIQILRENLSVTTHDIPVDLIATPRAAIEVERAYKRPTGILWDHLQPPQIHEIPVLERMGYA
jgi:5-formyltetrahydrofolate cyclo-ligase